MNESTGLFDNSGFEILYGDYLYHLDYDYAVKVVRGADSKPQGKLLCQPGHPCENIPYSLGDGSEYQILPGPLHKKYENQKRYTTEDSR